MGTAKIAITMEAKLLHRLDHLVKLRVFPNRSKAVQHAVEEKLAHIDRRRLARECAKLDPCFEQAMTEEGLVAETAAWPEY